MSIEPDTAVPEEDEDVPQGAGWDHLRAQHKKAARKRPPLVLELPEHEGVWVRFKYVKISERNRKAMEKVRALGDELSQGYWSCVDLLVEACDEILVATDKADPLADETGLKPLGAELQPPVPVRFDRMLARGLGWHDAHLLGGRQIVIRMFGDEGDYVLVEQAKQVAAWMGKERVHVEEEFTGE